MTAREPQQLAQDEIQAAAAGYRADNADFARWAGGYGVISHNDATQVKIHALAAHLQQQGLVTGPGSVYRMLAAAATGLRQGGCEGGRHRPIAAGIRAAPGSCRGQEKPPPGWR